MIFNLLASLQMISPSFEQSPIVSSVKFLLPVLQFHKIIIPRQTLSLMIQTSLNVLKINFLYQMFFHFRIYPYNPTPFFLIAHPLPTSLAGVRNTRLLFFIE